MHSALNKNPGLNCLKLIKDYNAEWMVILQAELTPLEIRNLHR
jgi:hypothetical protein